MSHPALPAVLLGGLALVTVALVACKETEQEQAMRGINDQLACLEGRQSACDRHLAETRSRCDGGDMEGCVLLGIGFQGGETPREAEAASLFQKACDAGNGSGCWYLGNALLAGRGTTLSLERARDAYDRGCTVRRENACISLGDLYSRPGALHDRAKALAAYDSGCAIPYKGACERAATFRATPTSGGPGASSGDPP